jgi:predicted nuclease of predicted toxin-antitoxin system
MKVKIDENRPAEIATDLRDFGHDAKTVVDHGMVGIAEEQLMSHAEEEFRILMTMDKGIASIQAYSPGRFAGLILLCPGRSGRKAVLTFVRKRLVQLLDLDLKGRLVLVSETRAHLLVI